MIGTVQVHAEEDGLVVRIPLKLRKNGHPEKKLMLTSTESNRTRPISRHEHATILKALGRAWRWKRMLESGEFPSITDLARAEKINHAYLRRILRLTLLSPSIVETLLDGERPAGLRLQLLLKPLPANWTTHETLTESAHPIS